MVEFASVDTASYDDEDDRLRAVAFVGDQLYAAAGKRGIAHLDIPALLAEHRAWQERFRGYEEARWPLSPTPRTTPAPSGGPVRFVTAWRGGLYLHTPGHGGAQSEWLAVEDLA